MRNVTMILCVFLGFFSQESKAQKNSFVPIYSQLSCNKQNRITVTREHPYTNNYDVSYYKLQLHVNPEFQYIQGAVTLHFTPSNNLTELYFELHPDLELDSVLHKNQPLTIVHNEFLAKAMYPFKINQLDSIRIYYHGVPPLGESFRISQHNNTPILWTLSEPYGARDWWPCKQSLTDKADSIDIIITCPRGNKVASNGLLQSEQRKDSLVTYHWKHRYPIAPYLVAIAVTQYSEINFVSHLASGNLAIQNYIYPEDSIKYRKKLFTTDTLLQYYDTLIGAYPFINEKYGHAQFSRGGGMEHQTMSFMNNFDFNLNAHELAHQWFGNKITCGSWQDIWLNEGFATYFAGLPLETWYDGKHWEEWKSITLSNGLRNNELSIFVEDTSTFERIFNPDLSYAKAAYVLHMLRKQIGDENFFAGIKSYIQDPTLVYQTALTQDFFEHMELTADTQLNLFKNQWIYGKGYPTYNVEWNQVGIDFELTLRQSTSNSETSFFNLSVPILLKGERDSLWIHPNPVSNQETFRWNVNFIVKQVIIDPNLDLISKGNFVIQKPRFTNLTMYPIPASQNLVIVPNSDFRNIDGFQIFSSTGKLIRNTSFSPTNNSIEIDVSQLTQGTYRIILKSEDKERTEGFVISR